MQDRLLPEEKAALNSLLTVEELGEAAAALSNAKCPGPDGILVEFYKAYWHIVGPLVLQCIVGGIEGGAFPGEIHQRRNRAPQEEK